MIFDQLIERPKRNLFLYKYAQNKAGKRVPDHFLFFENALY